MYVFNYFDRFRWPEVKYFSSKTCSTGVRIICIEKALSVLSLYICGVQIFGCLTPPGSRVVLSHFYHILTLALSHFYHVVTLVLSHPYHTLGVMVLGGGRSTNELNSTLYRERTEKAFSMLSFANGSYTCRASFRRKIFHFRRHRKRSK